MVQMPNVHRIDSILTLVYVSKYSIALSNISSVTACLASRSSKTLAPPPVVPINGCAHSFVVRNNASPATVTVPCQKFETRPHQKYMGSGFKLLTEYCNDQGLAG